MALNLKKLASPLLAGFLLMSSINASAAAANPFGSEGTAQKAQANAR